MDYEWSNDRKEMKLESNNGNGKQVSCSGEETTTSLRKQLPQKIPKDMGKAFTCYETGIVRYGVSPQICICLHSKWV